MLSEASQAQKDKEHMFFSHTWQMDTKDTHIHSGCYFKNETNNTYCIQDFSKKFYRT
jgi:hypothetical protein